MFIPSPSKLGSGACGKEGSLTFLGGPGPLGLIGRLRVGVLPAGSQAPALEPGGLRVGPFVNPNRRWGRVVPGTRSTLAVFLRIFDSDDSDSFFGELTIHGPSYLCTSGWD